ncbi:MAG: asparagine synthase (glutamine-hydrolyzing) [Anaerolineae bacterium]
MCGIAGMFLFRGQVDPSDLDQMGRMLVHRGPDKFAVSVIDNVGLAHNRLSIVDITSSGDQPFFNEKGYLIYNGEVYNQQELRLELEKLGIVFRGTSDTEVLFNCILSFGIEETLRKIKGMFAFAYYDRVTRRLYLCRDRFGIKSLYWTCNATGLYWASEVKALMAVPGVKIDPLRAFFTLTGSGDQSNKYTIFQNVFHVPPGNYLAIDEKHQPEVDEYYSIVQQVDEAYYRDLAAQPDDLILSTFEHLLDNSVQKMLMSDVPLGIFVSGGVDSSLIATLAYRHQANLALFTSDVVGKFSELPYSRLLAATLKAPLAVSTFRPEQLVEDLASATYHYEIPVIKFPHALPFSRVAELAHQQGVKPVLTGEGADELFLGYPSLYYDRYARLLNWPKDVIDRFYSLIPLVRTYMAKSQEEGVNDSLVKLVAGYERQYLQDHGGIQAYGFLPVKSTRTVQYQTIRLFREHLIALLHRNDRMGMQHSIESRFPFLDEDLVRFGVNLPLKYKTRSTGRIYDHKHPFIMDKVIVRLLARKILPAKLAFKPKWGFGIYNYRYMRVHPDYLKRGYLSDMLGLADDVVEYIARSQDHHMVAKLVGLEVFGRIFERQESVQSVTERNLQYITMETAEK